MNAWIRLLFGLIAMLIGITEAAERFPAPPLAAVESVSSNMQFEGITMQVRKFETSDSVAGVLNFYRRHWQDEGVVSDMPPWKMMTLQHNDELYTVQVQPQGSGAWGYLAVSDLPELVKKNRKLGGQSDFPSMRGSEVVNDNTSFDIGKQGRILLIRNHFSVPSNATYYREHFSSQGWSLIADESPVPQTQQMLYFQKDNESLSITIDKIDDHTSIVANQVKNGLFR